MTQSPISVPEPVAGLPPFSCLCSTSGSAVRVAVTGELDITTVPELDWVLSRAQAASDAVILDLSELEFIDSSGVQLLVMAARRVRRAGGRLSVVRGPAEVDWYFALVGLEQQLEFVAAPVKPGHLTVVEELPADP